jgi:hypothetical protein
LPGAAEVVGGAAGVDVEEAAGLVFDVYAWGAVGVGPALECCRCDGVAGFLEEFY